MSEGRFFRSRRVTTTKAPRARRVREEHNSVCRMTQPHGAATQLETLRGLVNGATQRLLGDTIAVSDEDWRETQPAARLDPRARRLPHRPAGRRPRPADRVGAQRRAAGHVRLGRSAGDRYRRRRRPDRARAADRPGHHGRSGPTRLSTGWTRRPGTPSSSSAAEPRSRPGYCPWPGCSSSRSTMSTWTSATSSPPSRTRPPSGCWSGVRSGSGAGRSSHGWTSPRTPASPSPSATLVSRPR